MTSQTGGQINWLARIRAWLRSDLRVLRWVFLALYLLLLVGLFGWVLLDGSDRGAVLICLGVMLVAQAMFIFGAGTIQLCRPIRRRRLVLPIIASSFMLTVLFAGLAMTMAELFKVDDAFGPELFWSIVGINWIGWGVLLFLYAKEQPRFKVLSRFSRLVFVGSLAELLATIPSHLIIRRRPGCFVGIVSLMGIIAGVGVMSFSFGPMIFVLFLRPMYRAEKEMEPYCCENCGYDLRASTDRCPECGHPFVRAAQTPSLDPHQT